MSVNRTAKPVATTTKSRLVSAREQLVCPGNETGVPLFTLPCQRNKDCAVLGPGLLCCQRRNVLFNRCLKGVPAPKPEPVHSRKLLLVLLRWQREVMNFMLVCSCSRCIREIICCCLSLAFTYFLKCVVGFSAITFISY